MTTFLAIGFIELELHHSAVQMNFIRQVLLRRSCQLPAPCLSVFAPGMVPIFAARQCVGLTRLDAFTLLVRHASCVSIFFVGCVMLHAYRNFSQGIRWLYYVTTTVVLLVSAVYVSVIAM